MLSICKVSKKFKTKEVLNGINYSFPNTGLYGIFGESGCGKSTLLNIITGLDNDYEGNVYVDEVNIKDKSLNIAKTFGIIFQHYNLLEDYNVFYNVKIAQDISGNYKEKINEKLKLVNLKEKLWYSKAKNLSGGEKQRVAIARAIINDPKVIVADEPTGALDQKNSRIVFEILKEMSKTKLVIVVSHNMKLLNLYCDKVLALSDLKEQVKINKKQPTFVNERFHDNSSPTIIKEHLKNNTFKYMIIAFSMFFTILFTSLSLSFHIMCKETSNQITKNYLDYNVFKVSKTKEEKIDNSFFSYTQMERPSILEVESLKKIIPDFEYFYDLTLIFP